MIPQIVMRPLLALIACCLTACTLVHGNQTTGTYTMASLGTDLKGYAQSASGITAESIDNSTSFREVNKSARFGIGAAIAGGIAKDLAGAWKSTTNAKTAAGVSNTAAQEATKQAGIQATTDQAKIAAEAAAAKTASP